MKQFVLSSISDISKIASGVYNGSEVQFDLTGGDEHLQDVADESGMEYMAAWSHHSRFEINGHAVETWYDENASSSWSAWKAFALGVGTYSGAALEEAIYNLTQSKAWTAAAGSGGDMRSLKVRACSIRCTANPQWGSFGVMEDHGSHYDIHGQAGSRVLSKDEAAEFWEIV